MTAVMPVAATIAPGIYWDLPAAVYHAAPGLSSSGMKSLAVSSLRYWHDYVRPDRQPRTETPAMKIGTALHAAVLEPHVFRDGYDAFLTKDDLGGCLKTVEDLKGWLQEHHFAVKAGMNKPELIAAAQRIDPEVPILDIEVRRHATANHNKILLDKDDIRRVSLMAKALKTEDSLKPILSRGRPEVSIFVNDPETGALLKCRVDWLHQCGECLRCNGFGIVEKRQCEWCLGFGKTKATVLDLKTFSSQDGTINEAVVKALRYRGYIRQARFYTDILKLAGLGDFTWINAFIESEAPYEVRLRSMGTTIAKYWESAGNEIRGLIKRYAADMAFYGTAQWACHQTITPVRDSEIRFYDEGEETDV